MSKALLESRIYINREKKCNQNKCLISEFQYVAQVGGPCSCKMEVLMVLVRWRSAGGPCGGKSSAGCYCGGGRMAVL